MDKRLASALSLCRKAGFIKAGEYACEKALQTGEGKYVIIAEDASDNTKKKFTQKAFYYETPTVIYGNSEELSRAIGAVNRKTIVVTDINFAERIRRLMEES